MPLKAWLKAALDRMIALCFKQPDLEFCWVGDDAVDPLEQAQTIAILVNAGVKSIAEARAELGLGQASGVAKFNPHHDERGRFTDADHAVEPGDSVQVAENENSPTMSDAGGGAPPKQVAQFEPVPMPEPAVEPPKVEAQPAPEANPATEPPKSNTTTGSGSATGLVDPALVDKLVASGVKITPQNVVATGTRPDGKIVWLETGDSDSGLQHIVAEHGSEFAAIGVSSSALPTVLMRAVTEGNIVGYQGQGAGRPIFQTMINGQNYNIAITIGNNGYIVGANLRGRAQ